MKLNYKKTILIGFGFMAASIAWAIYDPYITKILNRLLTDSAVITQWSEYLIERFPALLRFAQAQGEDVVLQSGGFTLVPLFIGIIMTFDNIFGVIFQPTFGKLSDRCHSRLGKRRPFIVIGAPVAAILFALIPWMNSIAATMTLVILFVFVMSLWRAPVVALMPDLTHPSLRSEGNAVINLMGGIGGLVGLVAGSVVTFVYAAVKGIPSSDVDEFATFPYVFMIGAAVMIIGMLVLLFFVKEPDSRLKAVAEQNMEMDREAKRKLAKEEARKEKAERKKQKLTKAERKSLIFMLGGLFFLFCATNSIQTFFALFADEILHKKTAQATILMGIFAVCAAIAALPAGKMGKKFGRKKTIMAGLSIFIAVFVVFMSTFVIMLSSDDLSISSYVSVNNLYKSLDSEITAENERLTSLGQLNADGKVSTINIDGYISYRKGDTVENEKLYADFDSSLTQKNYDLNSFVVAAGEVLGQEASDVGSSIQIVKNQIDKVTKILGVMVYPVLMLAGAANMFITVNTLPLVLEIGGVNKVGTFTGYYYTATFSAQIAAPITFGIYRMFSGTYMSLFYFCPVAIIISFLCILNVRHGEAIDDDIIKEAKESAD